VAPVAQIPRRGLRRRYTEVALNSHRVYRRLAISLVMAGGLLLFTGCQGITGGPTGTVGLGSGSLNFGSVPVGSSKTLPDTITNNSSSSVTISSIQGLGSGFHITGITAPLTLASGQSASFNVQFQSTSAGDPTVTISFVGPSAQPYASLSATATAVTLGALSPSPSSVAFGNVEVGANQTSTVTLFNTGGSSVTITQANVTGAVFSISGLTLPITLTANQSVTFTATFKPTSAGAAGGSLSVVSNASNSPLNIALSGTGTAAGTLAVSPNSLSFGSVTDGSSSALSGTLTASGASVTVSSASLNNSEFVLSGISLPATLTAGQSATFTVTFTPQASGATSASLSFASNASNSPTVQTMTGTGTAATQHTVDLSWTASADAVSYNIYRGTVSGGPYAMINSSPESTTSYNDSTVVSGHTYYYVATAVNSESQESGYSNQATAVIPTP